MDGKEGQITTIDEYIAQFPEEVQQILGKIRAIIKEEAPGATEKISYQLPTFYLNGNLVHFGAHEHHIGFYPTPSGIEAFKEELSIYKGAKGSVQFPLDQPCPMT
jgi:uncharacterized protein YdhG (YjbR/CyaY superfamily)